MSKHTPGPWKKIDSGIWSTDSSGDIQRIADVSGNKNDEADARLIAAAPELLEALKALVAAVERDDNAGVDSYARNFAIAGERVIKKVEGPATYRIVRK